MHTTSLTLLERLRQPQDQEAWARFVDLYLPLLYRWARRTGLQEPDAADLVQDVLGLLVRKLPAFRYDRRGSFRGWLRVVVLNRLRETRRRGGKVPQTNCDELDRTAITDSTADFEEVEYRRQLVGRALQLIEPEFSPLMWNAFRAYVVENRDVASVAASLGISCGTVYAAKSRVLTRLRQYLRGLLD